MGEVKAYIAIGSNIDPQENVEGALEILNAEAPIFALSTFYWSPPVGHQQHEQPPFLNGVCGIVSAFDARNLKFRVLRSIERRLGRVRGADKYAARPIDLDIAMFGDMLIDEPDLHAPDPDIATRPFLAVPLYELIPEGVLPDSGASLASIVNQMDTSMLSADEALTLRLNERFIS